MKHHKKLFRKLISQAHVKPSAEVEPEPWIVVSVCWCRHAVVKHSLEMFLSGCLSDTIKNATLAKLVHHGIQKLTCKTRDSWQSHAADPLVVLCAVNQNISVADDIKMCAIHISIIHGTATTNRSKPHRKAVEFILRRENEDIMHTCLVSDCVLRFQMRQTQCFVSFHFFVLNVVSPCVDLIASLSVCCGNVFM